MKKILLSALMFGFLLFALGNVSAVDGNGQDCIEDGVCDSYCRVVIDEPAEGEWYDPVTIAWHYEEWYDGAWHLDTADDAGECDNLLEVYLAYQEGSCGYPYVWNEIARNLPPSGMTHEWDVSELDTDGGEYCIAVNVDQSSGPDVGDTSGIFFLDLTAPVVDYNIYEGPSVGCEEEECDYYITEDTRIQLTCEEISDDEWQSGAPFTKYYRYSVDGGEFTDWVTYDGPFSFEEDSEHVMEYYCKDEVLKESDHKTATFIVESVKPTIETIVGEPKEPAEGDYEWYVTTNTEICLDVDDPTPHPVGLNLDSISCEGISLDENYCFTFGEDSYHTLNCWAEDKLGNREDFSQGFIVETEAPTTQISFEGPYYTDGYAQWIDGVSTVVLTSNDNPEVHPVDGEETFYRFGLVDDSYCNGEDGYPDVVSSEEECGEGEGWILYEEPFSIPQESCHAIEYCSIDSLENKEAIKTEYIFVDKTAPLTDKDVGNPSHDCNSIWEDVSGDCEEDWDWIVTMETQITLSCEDQSPHPSGVKGIWYRIVLDGDFEGAEWIFVPASEATIYFTEESEHQLDFYCVDNVDKVSETDSELFKVEGEELTIPLYKKWNLISIPFPLMSNNIDEVFSQISDKVEIVWSYDEDGWHVWSPEGPSDLDTIEPGYGYWVKATEDTELTVGGSLLSPAPGVPPSRQLQAGWNLIGRYGLDEDQQAYCALFSLVDTNEGFPRWSALVGHNNQNKQFTWLNEYSGTNPGEGFWIEMDVEDLYSPATTCWGFYVE